jgi:dTMP kinase
MIKNILEIKMPKGLFITFEGPDGSGKSTIISLLHEYLAKQNLPFNIAITHEPGGKNNVVAEDIRHILLNKTEYKITDRCEALLFAASRAQHVHDFIKPHLQKGDLVICDRYVHSSLVYQGLARGIGINKIMQINEFATDGVLPDLVIILMLDPHKGIERIKTDALREFNRLDQEIMSLHEKVYLGYQELVKNDTTNTLVSINASRYVNEVFEDVKKVVMDKINQYVKSFA